MHEEIKEIIDYNGDGKWSRDAVLARYRDHCRELKSSPRDLSPRECVQGSRKWVYPVMEKVIAGIEIGDPACLRIGMEFIEEDGKLPFGRILKSNTARALRRAALSRAEKDRIRKRLVNMLIDGNVPHEFKQYAKLLKKIGLSEAEAGLKVRVNQENPYVMKYFHFLTQA